jgi:acyl-CoA-binding protein
MFCFQLYALFKVANGEDISKAPAPGMFDLKVCSSIPHSCHQPTLFPIS